MTLPSYISLLRIILIIPIIYCINQKDTFFDLMALCLFLIAGITDYLDGYIARKTKTESSLGALLDLLADKLLVCIVLIWLTYFYQTIYIVIPVILIITRELAISSIRHFIVERIGKNPVKVTQIAKSKTTIQFIAISFLIISPMFGSYFLYLTILLLWLAVFISLYSLISYIKAYKNYF